MKLSTILLEEQNCGCGQTPCKTYGINERLNVSRDELNRMVSVLGADGLVDAILHIEDENVLDDLVAALNAKRRFGPR